MTKEVFSLFRCPLIDAESTGMQPSHHHQDSIIIRRAADHEKARRDLNCSVKMTKRARREQRVLFSLRRDAHPDAILSTIVTQFMRERESPWCGFICLMQVIFLS